ncbi:MAG TPA: four helix bundle protein [Kiritimatiellia bacterium]|jgi:four helix bundle protein|nr:four helix bundle protein [Kiritimatiellia bacterium]
MLKKRKSQYPISNVQYPLSKDGQSPLVKEGIYDLEDRLIEYAVRIIRPSEALPSTKAGPHVAGQILRSGTSPAPNYGEAQTAESAADFIHKLKIALKELRESGIWLRIIAKAHMVKSASLLTPLLHETDELIAIAFTSIQTAKQRKS